RRRRRLGDDPAGAERLVGWSARPRRGDETATRRGRRGPVVAGGEVGELVLPRRPAVAVQPRGEPAGDTVLPHRHDVVGLQGTVPGRHPPGAVAAFGAEPAAWRRDSGELIENGGGDV